MVNCGAPSPPYEDLRELARATAAHSTLVVDDHSSARIASKEAGRWQAGRIFDGPRNVSVERRDSQGAMALSLTHDGYVRHYGVIHGRDLALAASGANFVGRDRLIPVSTPPLRAELPFAVRFHLHPRVSARTEGRGDRTAPRQWRARAVRGRRGRAPDRRRVYSSRRRQARANVSRLCCAASPRPKRTQLVVSAALTVPLLADV